MEIKDFENLTNSRFGCYEVLNKSDETIKLKGLKLVLSHYRLNILYVCYLHIAQIYIICFYIKHEQNYLHSKPSIWII